MKKLFFSLIIVSLTMVSFANNKEGKAETSTVVETPSAVQLTGVITDNKSNEALVGVEVKIEGTDLKAYTDFDGKFSFPNLKPGEYNIETSYISYRKIVIEKVDVKGNSNNMVSIQLETAK
jgi:hypothetical protein